MKTFLFVLTIAFAVVLAGCATPMQRDVHREIENDAEAAAALHRGAATTPAPLYRKVDTPVVFGAPLTAPPAPAADRVLEQPITYAHGADGTLAEAVGYLSRATGIAMRVTPDAVSRASHTLGAGDDTAVGFAFSSQGSLRQVLDLLAARTGTSWRWSDNAVHVFYLDTRTFEVALLPSNIRDTGVITNTTQAGGSGGGSGGGGGEGGAGESQVTTVGGNSQTTEVTYQMEFFTDAERQIKTLLSADGMVAVSPSTASITVRDNAIVLEAVRGYIDSINTRLTRQVEIQLTILTVTQSDTDSFGINWDIVRQGLGDFYRVDALSTADGPLDTNTIQATVVDPNSPWQGSRLLIEALRQQANASIKRNSIVQAMNNQPVRVQTATQDTFLVNRTTTVVPQGGTTQSSFTTLQQTTGLSLTLLPRILDDERVLLQVQGSISAPLVPKRVDADGVELELPRTSLDDIFERAILRTGSTLVLTGIEQSDVSDDARGIGSARFSLFGGGQRASKAKRLVVIVLSPRIKM